MALIRLTREKENKAIAFEVNGKLDHREQDKDAMINGILVGL